MKFIMKGYNPIDLGLIVKSISGNEAICICPSHNDTNPSASFNMVSGWLYCFSCGYAAKVNDIANLTGGDITFNELNVVFYQSKEKLWKRLKLSPVAIENDYLKSRLVTNELVREFDIRQNKQGVIFPFKDTNDNWVGCQIRHYDKKPKYLTFGEKTLFPFQKLEHYSPLIPIYLTEGVFGALRGYQAGFQTLAVIGAMIKEDVLKPLQNYTIIGLFDDDLAGYIAGARLLKFLPHARIAIPGIEADEISLENWITKVPAMQVTRDIKTLANLSNNTKDFYKYVS